MIEAQLSKQQTILIVDDVKENIHVLSELLREDFKIKAATNGEKALSIAFSNDPPDIILLDIVMPGLDGYEVCKKLKESVKTKFIPVIFITGKVKEEDEVYGFTLGAVDYITKPFSPIVVKARINTHAELKRHRDLLENISYIDGLTGIPNRRKFDEYVEFIWNFSKQQSQPMSIILMDIDFFKFYNDYYGHQTGDQCLMQVASTLYGILNRKSDLVARYGGEEFVCVLPNVDAEEAYQMAEKFRQSILEQEIPHANSSIADILSISLGVATIVPDENMHYEELIKAADEALYTSKNSGRNKTSVALEKISCV